MSRSLSPITLLVLLIACKDGDADPADTDVADTDVTNPDPDVPDLDGTLGEATSLPGGDWSDPVEIASDALDPSGDHDFFTVELTEGRPYHLWVDTGANLLCDTVLRLYAPGATQAATVEVDPTTGEKTFDDGDMVAHNDDMIFRMSGSDPAILFVPPATGRYPIEILEYNDAIGDDPNGGSFCTYTLNIWQRSATEVECNDTTEVYDALLAADDPAVEGLPDDVTTPADQPRIDNRWMAGSREFAGWLTNEADDDLWRYRIPDVGTADGSAMWQWSLWPTDGAAGPRKLELLDSDLRVVARTEVPEPDGYHGFAADPGILYPVHSNTTWYLRVSSTATDNPLDTADTDPPAAARLADGPAAPGAGPAGPLGPVDAGRGDVVANSFGNASGTFYVGVSHGFDTGLTGCSTTDIAVPWWEHESKPTVVVDTDDPGDPVDFEVSTLMTNHDFGTAQLLKFCRVAGTEVYTSYTAGFLPPTGLPSRFARADRPDEGGPLPDFYPRCGGQTACPDRDMYVINTSSRAGTLGGRRLTVQVQAATVGSFVVPEVFLFADNEQNYPFAWSPGADATDETELSEPDLVVQTIVPGAPERVYVMVQPKEYGARPEQNAYFLRIILDPAPVGE